MEQIIDIKAGLVIDYVYLFSICENNYDKKIFKTEDLVISFIEKVRELAEKELRNKGFIKGSIMEFKNIDILYDDKNKPDVDTIKAFKNVKISLRHTKARVTECNQKCDFCKCANNIKQDNLDNETISILCEKLLENLINKEHKAYIFIGRYSDFECIINVYKKYGGNCIIIGCENDALKNKKGEPCDIFIDINSCSDLPIIDDSDNEDKKLFALNKPRIHKKCLKSKHERKELDNSFDKKDPCAKCDIKKQNKPNVELKNTTPKVEPPSKTEKCCL